MESSKWTEDTATRHDGKQSYKRLFGDSESAFYPASKDGLGDMFLHIAFNAPKECLARPRVRIAWALIRAKEPLLECTVVQVQSSQTEKPMPCFSFAPPTTIEEALARADNALVFNHHSKEELISNYMDGPRTLGDDHVSILIISTPEKGDSESKDAEYDLLMGAPHFTGDGTALHQSTHELLAILASNRSNEELLQDLRLSSNWEESLPPAFEHRCAVPQGRFAKAAAKVNFLLATDREIGGHTLPRQERGAKKTILLERDFTEEQTSAVLKHCKANGVTINHALFALCNVVWSRMAKKSFELPMMIYTAINLRAHLTPHPTSTYWFLALTYFNVVLPSFPPATTSVFWLRARSAKAQTRRIVQSPGLLTCSLEMARIRASRARGVPVTQPNIRPAPTSGLLPSSPPPSAALLGLSLIGNLDAVYVRSEYPSIHLRSVATASRLKAGGLLLLQHTFASKLWLNICFDANGFEEGSMERFWQGLQDAVEEFLC